MKIVNRDEFLKLPNGTIYQDYEASGELGCLTCKIEPCGDDDFIFTPIACDDLGLLSYLEYGSGGTPIELDKCYRDGLCKLEGLRYLIYEPEDVKKIIDLIQSFPVHAHLLKTKE